jgi:hypothetical protein
MKHPVRLDYTLGEGALDAYLAGLRVGKAIGGTCRFCRRTSFPPERVCACQHGVNRAGAMDRTELPGTAEIIHRTTGPGGTFVLVQFDGADNRAVCRLADPAAEGHRGRLCAAVDGMPGLILEIYGEDIESA